MRIIVVEDEAPIRNGLKALLPKMDSSYEVIGAAKNGVEGKEMILRMQPDLIVMDIQMPDMDGLTMLSQLRAEGNHCKVIVLTAFSDFNYAKRAIGLDIENYLLKPIKIAELKTALKQVEETIAGEEKVAKALPALEHFIFDCISGQLHLYVNQKENVQEAKVHIQEQYGINLDSQSELFLVWYDETDPQKREEAKELLEQIASQMEGTRTHVLEIVGRQLFLLFLFGMEERKCYYEQLQRKAVPKIMDKLGNDKKSCLIFLWDDVPNYYQIAEKYENILHSMEWNLIFGQGIIITDDKIHQLYTYPFEYSEELENQVKQAIIQRNQREFRRCYEQFREGCKAQLYEPKDIKEACIRYCWAILNTAKEYAQRKDDHSIQSIFQIIVNAFTWREIEEALMQFFHNVVLNEGQLEEATVSTLVQRAIHLLEENYSQGITLEEIAGKLGVSEEHLSTQFKKQTGKTFSETSRGYRIKLIRRLLVESNLKLNQIAEQTGYTDPKYMSKVFKEEMGISPAEYRKMNK